MDKKLKSKSKKREKKERGDRVMHEVENVGADDDAIGDAQKIGRDDIDETKMRKKKDKEKKKKKNKKGRGDATEVDVKGTSEEKSVGVFGEDGNGEGINDVERKKRKKEKNKKKNEASMNAESEVGSAEEIDKNGGRERPEQVSVSKMKSIKKGCEEEKSQNAESSHKDAGEKVVRQKRKREKKMDKDYDCFGRVGKENSGEILETFNEGENNNFAEKVKRKKKKKHKDDESVFSRLQKENRQENVDDRNTTVLDGNTTDKTEKDKKFKKKKRKMKDGSSVAQQDSVDKSSNPLLNTDGPRENEVEFAKVKKKKARLEKNLSEDLTPNKSNKKVRFSGEVEVFPLPDDSDIGNDGKDNLLRGKRFTKQEDAIVNEAVWNYIEEHELGEEGLNMVLNCSKHPQLRGCWKEIGTAIPYRPYTAIYYRAQILFRRSEKRKWTDEEYKMLLKYQEEHGNQWKAIADELGKHRWHVKDCWRRIKFPNLKKGNWTQQEYQQLFDLVNEDLGLKVFEEKKSQHGMLRDVISWTAISDKLSTRTDATCCKKWYEQLMSPMVAQRIWANADDYRLLEALYSEDAGCIEDVDWDDLLDDRSGEVCRKRWSQMVMHIGQHGNKSFAEQVEVLAHRYCPHLKEAREAWDSKPVVT